MGLYRRAIEYGMRGLEVDHPGLRQALGDDARAALAGMKKDDVPMLYWTSAAWSLAISLDKTDAAMAVNLPLAESLMHRALELDPSYGDGVIHDYYISYEGGRAGAAGGSIDRAREELAKSLELAKGRRAAPYLAFAESVSVGTAGPEGVHRAARRRAGGEARRRAGVPPGERRRATARPVAALADRRPVRGIAQYREVAKATWRSTTLRFTRFFALCAAAAAFSPCPPRWRPIRS